MSVTGPYTSEEALEAGRRQKMSRPTDSSSQNITSLHHEPSNTSINNEHYNRQSPLPQDTASGWPDDAQFPVPRPGAAFRESSRVIQTGDVASRRHRDLHLESRRAITREWGESSDEHVGRMLQPGSGRDEGGAHYLVDQDSSRNANRLTNRSSYQSTREVRHTGDIAQRRGAPVAPSPAATRDQQYDARGDGELVQSHKWRPDFDIDMTQRSVQQITREERGSQNLSRNTVIQHQGQYNNNQSMRPSPVQQQEPFQQNRRPGSLGERIRNLDRVPAANNSTISPQAFSHTRQQVRQLQPLQLRDTMSRSRAESLQSPLGSSISWKGENMIYDNYNNGQPSQLSERQQSVYQPDQIGSPHDFSAITNRHPDMKMENFNPHRALCHNSSDTYMFVCSTISKDNTTGEHARKSDLLASFGKKLQRQAINVTAEEDKLESSMFPPSPDRRFSYFPPEFSQASFSVADDFGSGQHTPFQRKYSYFPPEFTQTPAPGPGDLDLNQPNHGYFPLRGAVAW